MSRSKNRVAYPREGIIAILRTLEELVVSLDRIGSEASEMSAAEFNAAMTNFIVGHDISRKAATARQILSEPFATRVGPDDSDELERAFRGIRFWRGNVRTTSEAPLTDAVWESAAACLNQSSLTALKHMRLPPKMKARLKALTRKASRGTLTRDDTADHMAYFRAKEFLSKLQSTAHLRLKRQARQHGKPPRGPAKAS